jgi:hypothetical protein
VERLARLELRRRRRRRHLELEGAVEGAGAVPGQSPRLLDREDLSVGLREHADVVSRKARAVGAFLAPSGCTQRCMRSCKKASELARLIVPHLNRNHLIPPL